LSTSPSSTILVSQRTELPSKRTELFSSPGGMAEESSSGGLMSMKSLQSQLASAFTALDERDQYDAVLTGLCAKILDQPAGTPPPAGEEITDPLRDPMQLVDEMNSRRIKASPRSLMAFIDVRPKFSPSARVVVI